MASLSHIAPGIHASRDVPTAAHGILPPAALAHPCASSMEAHRSRASLRSTMYVHPVRNCQASNEKASPFWAGLFSGDTTEKVEPSTMRLMLCYWLAMNQGQSIPNGNDVVCLVPRRTILVLTVCTALQRRMCSLSNWS
jgi:hypothetical protein